MNEPTTYFLTWTTYGSWLPGDPRAWVNHHNAGPEAPVWNENKGLAEHSQFCRKQEKVVLTSRQRECVETVIQQICEFRVWSLLAINVRTNHVHVVVTATESPERVMNTFKSWASRKLNEINGQKIRWWTRHGSTRYVNQDSHLKAAIRYVMEQQ
ncbi:MAG: transposase [Planctomycetaceae bacterium]